MEKEKLTKLVEQCITMRELLTKLNITISGENYQKMYQMLEKFQIDSSKFKERTELYGFTRKIDLKHILVENSSYKNSYLLKKRLIEEGLKENKCEICNQLPEHMGKPLSLQLHHINGNHNDNRLENLQILCPNCHSQTDNYGIKNAKIIKKHNYCSKCGREISRKASLCLECLGEEKRKVKRPSKEELLELIKTKSFCEIGRMFGVSDNAVRKWCKAEGLPYLKREIKKLL